MITVLEEENERALREVFELTHSRDEYAVGGYASSPVYSERGAARSEERTVKFYRIEQIATSWWDPARYKILDPTGHCIAFTTTRCGARREVRRHRSLREQQLWSEEIPDNV